MQNSLMQDPKAPTTVAKTTVSVANPKRTRVAARDLAPVPDSTVPETTRAA